MSLIDPKHVRTAQKIEDGIFEIQHFNWDLEVWDTGPTGFFRRLEVQQYPDFDFEKTGLYCYGVCDSPGQFLEKYRTLLEGDVRKLCIGFTHVTKDPLNKGQGGGWRWHKWGPYVGNGKPTTEYLDDEPEFDDGVWTFHILALTDEDVAP